jgi:hypothetical protein
MFKRDFDFIDDNELSKLSVLITADSFFYSVFGSKNTLLCHYSYTDLMFSDHESIAGILADANLKRKYQSIIVLAVDGDAFQLPEEDHQLAAVYPGFEYKVKKIEKIAGNNTFNYFGVTPAQQSMLDGLFGNDGYKLNHVSTLLGSYFVGDSANVVYVHIEEKKIFIYVQKHGNMVFFNAFPINALLDVLYFVLSVCKFSDIDPTEDKICLGGWIEKESAIYKLLAGYIRRLEFIQIFNQSFNKNCNEELKSHFYFLHFANNECAL